MTAKVKSTVGRKQWDGKDEQLVLGKLEEAYALDCTDAEACLYAGISTQALYKYQDKNPSFVERKRALKSEPVLLARRTVVNALETDTALAFKYLERKCRNEFAVRSQFEIKQETDFDNLTDEDLIKLAGVSVFSKQ